MLDIDSVPYTAAMGRVLAEDIVAKDPLPPFPASIKVCLQTVEPFTFMNVDNNS